MSNYVDVYLLPIAEENIEKYRQMATDASRIFLKHGALRYREYVASDLKVEEVVPFPAVIKLEPGETIVYAAVEFESEEARNKAMEEIMRDPDHMANMPKEPPFDYKKMVYGGFKILVDA